MYHFVIRIRATTMLFHPYKLDYDCLVVQTVAIYIIKCDFTVLY